MPACNRAWIVWTFGVVLGFFGGVVVTLAVVGTSPEPSEEGVPSAAVMSHREPVPSLDLRREPAPAPDMAQVLAKLEAASDPLSGPTPDWSPGDGYLPPAVRASLQTAFAGTDIRLDCREFPCIGVIETGPDLPADLARDIDAHGFPRDAYGEIVDQLSSLGLEDQSLAVRQAPLDGGGYRILVAWLSKEREAELHTRLQTRIDWLAEHGSSAAGVE